MKKYAKDDMLKMYLLGKSEDDSINTSEDLLKIIDKKNQSNFASFHNYLQKTNALAWWKLLDHNKQKSMSLKYPPLKNELLIDHIIRVFSEELEIEAKKCGF